MTATVPHAHSRTRPPTLVCQRTPPWFAGPRWGSVAHVTRNERTVPGACGVERPYSIPEYPAPIELWRRPRPSLERSMERRRFRVPEEERDLRNAHAGVGQQSQGEVVPNLVL